MNQIFRFHNRVIVGQVIFTGIIAFIILFHQFIAFKSTFECYILSSKNESGSIVCLSLSMFLALSIFIFVIGCCYFLFQHHTIEIKENEIVKTTKLLFIRHISACKRDSIKKVLSIREGVDQEGPDSFSRYALLIETSDTYLLIGEQKNEIISILGKTVAEWAKVQFIELGEAQYDYQTKWKRI